MKVFIKRHIAHAGFYIYRGYKSAWEEMGYTVEFYDKIYDLRDESNFFLMAVDADVDERNIIILEKSKKTFLYVQPNIFPAPWGSHPNYICHCSDYTIDRINKASNVFLWTWCNNEGVAKNKYFPKWKTIETINLAFDSVNYSMPKERTPLYDVCFIGGWANNGFNEKRKIMLDIFSEFKDSGLKCGFFINKNLTHEQENETLYRSKTAINIHDTYQRILGLDTNERTFKALGATGILVSDKVLQVSCLFPNTPIANTPSDMVALVKEELEISEEERSALKEKNRNNIIENHTYIKRAQEMLAL